MDELEKILAAKDLLIDERLKAILEASNETANNIPDVVFAIAADLVKNGKLQFNQKTILTLSDIAEILKQSIKSTSYLSDVKGFTRDYSKIVGYTSDMQKSLNNLDIKTDHLYKFANESSSFVQERLLTNIAESEEFGQKLKTVLLNSAVTNQTLSQVKKSVSDFLNTGTNANVLTRYTTQVTRDAMNQFEGQLNSNIAINYEMEYYRYVGSIIADSRAQCKKWVGMRVLPIKDLDKEINWAYANGSGMIAGTTKTNFAVFKGGFSCRHTCIPTNMNK